MSNAPIKRGPPFKPHSIQAILNTSADRTPIDPSLPIKWQTRRLKKPSYEKGDTIALLESYQLGDKGLHGKMRVIYPGDATYAWGYPSEEDWAKINARKEPKRIMSGIYMPAWASRISATVLDVRQEFLQSISEKDAQAEGVPPFNWDNGASLRPIPAFAHLWDSINGDRTPWEQDPLVWVTAFQVVEAKEFRPCTAEVYAAAGIDHA